MNRLSFLLFLAGVTFLAACHAKVEPVAKPTKFCISDSFQKMITIDSVQLSGLEDDLELSGEVAFDENSVIKVFPNSSGQVTQSPVTLGDKVVQGQTLAIIKSADVAGSYSDLSSSDVDVAIAKRQLTAAESLYKNGIASQREYEEAQHNYEKAVTAKDKLQNTITINGGGNTKAGGNYVIRAPRSGYVVEKKVNAGSFIRGDMSDNLFTISDLKDVWVYANVFENDIPRVKEGYDVTVTTLAYPDKKFYGRVDKISQVLDPQSRALRVRIRLDNANMLLKPDMFTKVHLTHASGDQMLSVPNNAIIENTGKNFVVVYNSNCDLKVQEVNIKKVGSDKTFVAGGLVAGQKVLTKHALELFNQLVAN
jgi:cobalt-zinc-cadmium efflux system membrane fusion protein